MTRARITGAADIARRLQRYGQAAQREAWAAQTATAFDVQRTAVRSIQRAGTGQVYDSILRTVDGRVVPVAPRTGTNLSATHRASAPGEAPATDTGALASSVAVDLRRSSFRPVARVGTGLEYGAYLEFGTQAMDARPWLWPALKANRDAYRQRMSAVHDKAVRRAL